MTNGLLATCISDLRHVRSAALSLVVLVCVSACTDQPRNNSTIASRTQTYSGYYAEPGASVSIQVYDRIASKWQTIGSGLTASSPTFTDGCGLAWYHWQKTVTFPATSPRYWAWIFRAFLVETRVVDTRTKAPLISFDEDSDECIASYECGTDVVLNCGDPLGRIVLFCAGSNCS